MFSISVFNWNNATEWQGSLTVTVSMSLLSVSLSLLTVSLSVQHHWSLHQMPSTSLPAPSHQHAVLLHVKCPFNSGMQWHHLLLNVRKQNYLTLFFVSVIQVGFVSIRLKITFGHLFGEYSFRCNTNSQSEISKENLYTLELKTH